MPVLREAAGFEGLAVLAVIYFLLSLVARSGRKPGATRPRSAGAPPAPGGAQEGFSLEAVLREIQRVKEAKQEERRAPLIRPAEPAPPVVQRQGRMAEASRQMGGRPRALSPGRRAPLPETERGPLGRHSQVTLPSAQGEKVVDLDNEAEQVVERRIQEAEARNRALTDADHVAFDRSIREAPAVAGPTRRYPIDQLKQAFVWREILGPPRAFD